MAREIYTVKSGEHLSAIGAQHGFANFTQIWELDGNAPLREAREDPHQLVPGDKVVIPTKRENTVIRNTAATHKFVVQVEKLKVRVQMLDLKGNPQAGVSGKVTAGTGPKDIVTQGNGVFESRISRNCTNGTLEVGNAVYDLGIGALAPISEASGRASRLVNLGFWYGNDDDFDDPHALKLAVELFQSSYGLQITGIVDDAFVAKLKSVHDGKD